MSTSSITTLLTGKVTDIGTAALTILTAVLGLVVAYFIYRWGVRKVKGSLR